MAILAMDYSFEASTHAHNVTTDTLNIRPCEVQINMSAFDFCGQRHATQEGPKEGTFATGVFYRATHSLWLIIAQPPIPTPLRT